MERRKNGAKVSEARWVEARWVDAEGDELA
jgi:hypothetical protein